MAAVLMLCKMLYVYDCAVVAVADEVVMLSSMLGRGVAVVVLRKDAEGTM